MKVEKVGEMNDKYEIARDGRSNRRRIILTHQNRINHANRECDIGFW